MNVSTPLDPVDNGHMAFPEFERGYVWNRDQVRGPPYLNRHYAALCLPVRATAGP